MGLAWSTRASIAPTTYPLHDDAFFRDAPEESKLARVKATTRQLWGERVRAWRASEQDAGTFAADIGYAASTLRWWSSQIGRDRSVRMVPVVTRAPASTPIAEVVVEVGGARLRVAPGFDAGLLAEVVRALGGAR